ncbi:MAG: efflux RND transporter periplasmic adaptor subunit, partial [Planctomycetales bacterium]|nr:efflux RND transporter periplasmic adaptor subunit [Planctomycetales bacterium]
ESRVAQAELARTRAQGRLAASNLERKEKLIGQNAISRQELEQFQVASEVAQAEIEAAQRRIDRIVQSIALLDVRLSDTQIEAPYDASVVARHVEPGDWVAAGDPLLTLVSTGPIQAWLEVPERFADEISRFGDSVIVHSPSTNQSYKSTSTKRVADVNPRVRTLSFIATISNQDNRLAAGMSVDAWIASGEEQTYLTVPTDAVIRHASEAFVFGVNRAGEASLAKRHAVQVLFETPALIAIASPHLRAGDEVIVEGNERLLPEQAVVVVRDADLQSQIANK